MSALLAHTQLLGVNVPLLLKLLLLLLLLFM
jgi:hypothetical protein